jgi:hypothetical protein
MFSVHQSKGWWRKTTACSSINYNVKTNFSSISAILCLFFLKFNLHKCLKNLDTVVMWIERNYLFPSTSLSIQDQLHLYKSGLINVLWLDRYNCTLCFQYISLKVGEERQQLVPVLTTMLKLSPEEKGQLKVALNTITHPTPL